MTRRQLFSSVATGLTTNLFTGNVSGANDAITVGFIGTGGMGKNNMKACMNQKGIRVSYVCDVYEENLSEAVQKAEERGHFPNITRNFQEVLDDHNTDAVCISTPDHWHAYMVVEAMKRGKHVYCEKPIAHKVEEVKAIVEVGRKYKTVFQSGQWQRSCHQFVKAVDYVKSGIIGKISDCRIYLYWDGRKPDLASDSKPPSGLGDWGWDIFLGPAPYHQFNVSRFLYTWRYFWDYANGMAGDWGPHTIDIVQLAMNSIGPQKITSTGRIGCDQGNGETPNVWSIQYDFGDFWLTLDYNACELYQGSQRRYGDIQFIGKYGSILVNRSFCKVLDRGTKEIVEKNEPADKNGGVKHWQDFIEHIRCNDPNTRASLENVGPTTITCLLATAALKNGGALRWNPKTLETDDSEAKKYLEYSHREPWKLTI